MDINSMQPLKSSSKPEIFPGMAIHNTHLLAISHLPNVAEKPFLSIGCNSSELGTDDPRFVSIGGALLDHGRGLQRVASERRVGRANANANAKG